MESYFSIFLYLITFLCGFLLNNRPDKKILKRIFVIWLYIFLCFGYTTGSDWRSYELEFDDLKNGGVGKFTTEPIFGIIFTGLSRLFGDFYLSLGILKMAYLYTLLKLLKKYTPYSLTSVALLLPASLLFLLIDNPLRYMTALIFVNMAIISFKNNKVITCYLWLLVSIFVHNTCVFFLILPTVLKYATYILKIKSWILIVGYVMVVYTASNPTVMAQIQNSALGVIMQYMEMKDYGSYYDAGDSESFFTLGNFLQMSIGVLMILSKYMINRNHTNESFMYGMAIASVFLSSMLIVIPTGFRLGIPFGYFYAMYIALLIHKKYFLGYFVSGYLMLMMMKNVYSAYTYVPYTNSIYHIITQDYDSYYVRSNYNIKAYKERTGKDVDSQ